MNCRTLTDERSSNDSDAEVDELIRDVDAAKGTDIQSETDVDVGGSAPKHHSKPDSNNVEGAEQQGTNVDRNTTDGQAVASSYEPSTTRTANIVLDGHINS